MRTYDVGLSFNVGLYNLDFVQISESEKVGHAQLSDARRHRTGEAESGVEYRQGW